MRKRTRGHPSSHVWESLESTATHGGVRAVTRLLETRRGYGARRCEWDRTDKGPQKSWLHHIGKSEGMRLRSPGRGFSTHQVRMPRFGRVRTLLLGNRNTWAELHKMDWRKEGEESFEATDAFFSYLYHELT